MMLSIEDYAKHSGLPSSTIRKMVKKKTLPAMMISGKWWLEQESADETLKSECAKNVNVITKPTINDVHALYKHRQQLFN